MGIKEKLQERIEKNAVKSEMSWTDKKGKTHTEEVYLKRSRMPLIGDWARIYPPVDENGNWNWINLIFGGKKNFIKLLAIFAIVLMVLFAFNEVFSSFELFKNQPCVQSCIEMEKLKIVQLPKLIIP